MKVCGGNATEDAGSIIHDTDAMQGGVKVCDVCHLPPLEPLWLGPGKQPPLIKGHRL
jgi:hypothetical protein